VLNFPDWHSAMSWRSFSGPATLFAIVLTDDTDDELTIAKKDT
jgi:hypothetical protein